IDYVFVEGKGIIVTGLAKKLNTTTPPAPQTVATAPPATAIPETPPVPAGPPQSRQPEPQPPVLTNVGNEPAAVQNPPPTVPPQPVIPPAQAPSPAGLGQTPPTNPFNSTLPGFMAPNALQQAAPSPGSTSGIPSVNSPFNTTNFNSSPWSYPTLPPTS